VAQSVKLNLLKMNKKGLATKPKPEPFTLLLKVLFLILLLLGVGLPSTVFGQGDIQVDPTTGRANMTIPITTLRSKDIQHPVGLSYSTGGFKVGTPIGKAGLGWSLFAGGMISRELRGLPDDFEDTNHKGWLKSTAGSLTSSFSPTADDNWANASDEGSDHTALAAFGGYDGTGTILDTEPDIFYINAAGVGGSFILHHDGTIKSMPYNDYEIVPTYDNGELESFEITNALGVTHHFDHSD